MLLCMHTCVKAALVWARIKLGTDGLKYDCIMQSSLAGA